VIDHKMLTISGAISLRQTGDGFVATPSRPKAGDRPWAPAVLQPPESDPRARRPGIAPQPDATPAQTDLTPDEL
jgi:hypothetical protein